MLFSKLYIANLSLLNSKQHLENSTYFRWAKPWHSWGILGTTLGVCCLLFEEHANCQDEFWEQATWKCWSGYFCSFVIRIGVCVDDDSLFLHVLFNGWQQGMWDVEPQCPANGLGGWFMVSWVSPFCRKLWRAPKVSSSSINRWSWRSFNRAFKGEGQW